MPDKSRITYPIDLSIPLRFNGPQPNAYGVEPAVSAPVSAGGLIGDTRKGGSVNFERCTLIPHCNGTHTECVGHITHERISIRDCLQDVLIRAVLVSAEPVRAENGDEVITAHDLNARLGDLPDQAGKSTHEIKALIVRTLPNGDEKLCAEYGGERIPPYFSAEAMRSIVARGFTHLLCDLPSIDRIFDEGRLVNHRIFWNVDDGSFETNPDSRLNATITELIYVPAEVPDGEFLLNLQIAPFESDCAPSRPMLLESVTAI